MPDITLTYPLLLLLFGVGLLGGFVDAIAGGGGLLTLPVYMLTGIDTPYALGTNKGQSVFGSSMSLTRYYHSNLLDRQRAKWSFIPAVIGSAIGALMITWVDRSILTPLIMCLLGVVAIFMIVYRPPQNALPPRHRSPLLAIAVSFTIAWYDGFFGPGTGTFLILAYAFLWNDPLDAASANAKVVNFGSNLGSMLLFASKGLILWKLSLPMAAGQLLGGWLGAHVTIRVGRQLVRYAVIAVSLGLILRLAWQLGRG